MCCSLFDEGCLVFLFLDNWLLMVVCCLLCLSFVVVCCVLLVDVCCLLFVLFVDCRVCGLLVFWLLRLRFVVFVA